MKPVRAPRHTREPRGPFAHLFDVRSLKGEPRQIELTATPEECAAVAQAVDLPGIAALRANFRLVPRAGGRIELGGRVTATVTQVCVVTLEPFEARVDQEVGVSYAPAPEPIAEPRGRGGRGDRGAMEVLVPVPFGGNDDQEDPSDPIVDERIDLGAVAVEFMVLGLDPYPRKPGVHFDDMVVGDKGEPEPSAFAGLARLKDRQ